MAARNQSAIDSIDWLVSELLASRKTARLHPDFLRRIAARAWDGNHLRAPALKAAKRKIHQVHGAYLGDPRMIARASELLARAERTSAEGMRAVCRRILALHASSRERLPVMGKVYEKLWSLTGPPRHVLDVACGLNPFSLPWMQLPAGAAYTAIDVDCALIDLAAEFLRHWGADPVAGGTRSFHHSARCCDVVTTPPEAAANVAFFLKSYPCFEQQGKDIGLEVVAKLRADWIVVSFPARSLGGRRVGMERHYSKQADRLLAQLGSRAESFALGHETYYVIDRRVSSA